MSTRVVQKKTRRTRRKTCGTLARSMTRKIHLWSTWRLRARKVSEENASLESNGSEERQPHVTEDMFSPFLPLVP